MGRGLFSRIFGGAPQPARPEQPCLPPGQRLYAIGDVHGRFDLLERLLAEIRADAASAPPGTAFTLLFLGDYVDRGLQSREVIELLAGDPWPGADKVFLRGNHDEMMRRFLEAPDSGRLWFDLGGAATLYSYGIGLGQPGGQQGGGEDLAAAAGGPGGRRRRAAAADDWGTLAGRLAEALPAAHRRFLDETRFHYSAGDYLFVHAGVRPGVPLARQDPEELMNIREPFLTDEVGCEQLVVHGHTPVRRPTVTPTRIAVDTGAYMSGRLTALVLEGGEQRFLQS
ncbi:metallophosphoesterase family protein [Tistlia consotensis]|nr:metallophosphoesterase family protein [Tistlia consotensis]